MTARVQVTLFWLLTIFVMIALLYVFRSIMLPFVAGAALAYMLDPLAARLERIGMSRTGASVLIVVGLVIVFAFSILAVVPFLVSQAIDLINDLPGYVQRVRELLAELVNSRVGEFFGFEGGDFGDAVGRLFTGGLSVLTNILQSIWSGGMALVNIASLAVVTPFVAFYLLRDWSRLMSWVDDLLPREHAETIRHLAAQIDNKIAAFLRGQVMIGLLLGLFYATGLVLVGLDFGLLVGLISGVLSFIPYLGFTVGFVLSIILAIAQFWPEYLWIGATAGVFFVGQMIEGYVLQPRFLGERVGLHPVWLFFSLFAFGLLFGFVGLLIAVPAAAAVGVLLNHAIEQYRGSHLYLGAGSDGND